MECDRKPDAFVQVSLVDVANVAEQNSVNRNPGTTRY